MRETEVTPALLIAAAGTCDRKAGEIDVALGGLRSYVTDLQSVWHGVASDRFNLLMADFDRYGRMLHHSLTEIAVGLRANALHYTDTEDQNIKNIVAVNGGIPGARL